MKTVIVDANGGEHELEAVVLGIAADIHRLNQRLIRIEKELNISYEAVTEEPILESEE